jgi:ABC-type transporter Mla MlaB component
MLKITRHDEADGRATLRLEGRLAGAWVAEARNSCELLLEETGKNEIDMRDVTFVDSAGLLWLLELRRRGVPLVHCSSFVTEQLKVFVS